MIIRIIFSITLTVVLLACGGGLPKTPETTEAIGINLLNLDTTIRPSEDLFRYVNGGWIFRTTIPDDRGSYGAFNELTDRNNKILRKLLSTDPEVRDYIEGTDQRKAADFFRVGMDSLLAEEQGITPVQSYLARIDGISGKSQLQNFLTEEDGAAGDAFFSLRIEPDMKKSRRMALYISSGGIGLPDRDYYFNMDGATVDIREKYKKHILRMLVLSGFDESKARKSIERIWMIETELARATLIKEDRRDPLRLYNKYSVEGLSSLVPSIDWKAYLLSLHAGSDSVVVTEPAFLRSFERIVNIFSWEDLRLYLRWSVIRKAAPFLSHSFVLESFEFNQRTLLGANRLGPRWKRVLEIENRNLGQAIGKLFVAKTFPPEARQKAMEMVENIRFAFADRIKQLDWMSDSTKRKALLKLSAITVKIGYPDKWKTYAGLIVDRKSDKGSFYGNMIRAQQFKVRESIALLNKPVDKSIWDMNPQTVNAAYNPMLNEIVFPAGILQPPFFDYRADEAVNYGGIGGAIGHEITHGFDDEGSRYDAEGNLRDWWTAEDFRRFRAKGQELVDQFNGLQPLPGLFVQGRFTLGENIGDLGGLNAAFDGLKRSAREANRKDPHFQGFTEEQRFFMSWATIWRVKYRDEALRTQVLTNEHPPGMYRANGPVSNMPGFYKAFGVRAGDKLYRDQSERITIW